ncbi:MAG: HDIG domain-containing protein [Planctomycetes bacterium]|nr:HDIG domain-containing protein [Planctomycetota bacterium]
MNNSRRKKKAKRFGAERPAPQEARTLWLHVDARRLVNGLIFGFLFAACVAALNYHAASKTLSVGVSNGILILAICTLYSLYLVSFERSVKTSRAVIAVGVVSLLPVAAAAWFPVFGIPLFLVPMTLVAFVFGISFSERTAIGASFMLCLLVGVCLRTVSDGSQSEVAPTDLMAVLFAGAAAAALGCGNIRKRSKLLKVGLISSIVQAALIAAVKLKAGQPVSPWVCSLGFINGAVSAALVSAALPMIESIFMVTTDISLLELSDQNHPLLRRLSLEAPGTYHHSLILGNLAEAAGEAIGANALLLRVGAYFHDIGKVVKPEYFVENEGMQGSMHGDLSPTMSTLIITAHTKDGAELAREQKLPNAIIDMIRQHHGSSLVEYFYRRAIESSDGKKKVDQSLFRHPGPNPQTREAGVLLLADSVESASRSLPDPTPSRIARQVHEIINRKLMAGQLDECELTLAEVHRVEQSLVRSLTSVLHGRIKYPEPEDRETAEEEHNGR